MKKTVIAAACLLITCASQAKDHRISVTTHPTIADIMSINLMAGDTVTFECGIKNQWQGTLKLTESVTYRSIDCKQGQRPAFVGSISLKNLNLTWTKDTSTPSKGWYADITSLIPNDIDLIGNPVEGGISQVFYNSNRLTRARHPNLGEGSFRSGKNRFFAISSAAENSKDDSIPPHEQSINVGSSLPVGKDILGADFFVKTNDFKLIRYKSATPLTNSSTEVKLVADDKEQRDENFLADLKKPRDLDWPGTTNDVPQAGFGYWAEGKLWMQDAENEWHLESKPKTLLTKAKKLLYVRLPGNVNPRWLDIRFSTYLHGITARGLKKVDIDGIDVKETRADGIAITGYADSNQRRKLASLSIKNSNVSFAGRKGINVVFTDPLVNRTIPDSVYKGIIDGVNVSNSINEGIDISGDRRWSESTTSGITISNSVVTGAGNGYFARAGILLGNDSKAINNKISETSYLALNLGQNSTASGNQVSRFCLAFDDCGAIYTEGTPYLNYNVKALIEGNFVFGDPSPNDRLDGSPSSNGYNNGAKSTNIVGIYLDDYTRDATVTNNHVEGTDIGILLHQTSDTKVLSNNVVGNRSALLVLKNLRGKEDSPIPPVLNNIIENNVFATDSSAPIVKVYDDLTIDKYTNTGSASNPPSEFASFKGNKYATLSSLVFGVFGSIERSDTFKSAPEWLSLTNDTTSTIDATAYSAVPANSNNLIGYDSFTTATPGDSWDYDKNLLLRSFEGGNELTFSTLPSNTGLTKAKRRIYALAPAKFPTSINQKFIVKFDVRRDDLPNASNAKAEMVLTLVRLDNRRDVSIPVEVAVDSQWRTITRLLTAKEASAESTLTFDMYTDAKSPENPVSSSKLRLRNVSIKLAQAPVTGGNSGAIGLANPDLNSAALVSCINTATVNCYGSFKDIVTDERYTASSPVNVQATVAPGSSRVLIPTDSALRDSNFDGVAGN